MRYGVLESRLGYVWEFKYPGGKVKLLARKASLKEEEEEDKKKKASLCICVCIYTQFALETKHIHSKHVLNGLSKSL